MAVDALAPSVARASTAMEESKVFVFQLLLPVSFQGEMM